MSDDNEPVDIDEIFTGLFGGPDTRTPEERAAAQAQWDREANERDRQQFERNKTQRADKLAEEARIRKIVTEELNKFVWVGCSWVVAGYLGYQYGTWAFFATMIAVWAWQLNVDRKAKLKPEYMLDEMDDLAEDTVLHERVVALESLNQPWIVIDDDYGPDWETITDKPYWEQVNSKVRDYRWKSHKQRLADNAAARAASLPFRKAKLTHIQSINPKWELPYWARIRTEEGGAD